MANKIDICNGALTKIGASQINTLDDGNKSSIKCKLRYEHVRKYVLRSHPWKCIKNRATLNPEVSSPATDWEFQFKVPSDVLRLWLVKESSSQRALRQYDYERNRVLTDCESIDIYYGQDIEDATTYDDMLVEAISFYLAFDICYSITNDRLLTADMGVGYDSTLRLAKSVDGKEDHPNTIQSNKWNNSRRISRGPVDQFPHLR